LRDANLRSLPWVAPLEGGIERLRGRQRGLGTFTRPIHYLTDKTRGRTLREFVFGIIVLILDIWAIVSIIGSSASTGAKVLWIILILILPVVGFIIWFFAGPRSRTAAA
jgi:hypothetical protein